MSQDPISDMFAMINNANHKFMERVDLPASSAKKDIAQLLKDQGYIADYKVLPDRKQGVLRLFMKYQPNKVRVIQGVRACRARACGCIKGLKNSGNPGRVGHVDRVDLQRVDDRPPIAQTKTGRRSHRQDLVRIPMSRLGKKPIPVSDKVKVSIQGPLVSVTGPLGQLSRASRGPYGPLRKGTLVLDRRDDSTRQRSLHGTFRKLLSIWWKARPPGSRKN
jgi:ribosomal protein S8